MDYKKTAINEAITGYNNQISAWATQRDGLNNEAIAIGAQLAAKQVQLDAMDKKILDAQLKVTELQKLLPAENG